MSSIKKLRPLPPPIERETAVGALKILFFEKRFEEYDKTSRVSDNVRKKYQEEFSKIVHNFMQKDRPQNDRLNNSQNNLLGALYALGGTRNNNNYMNVIIDYFYDWSNYLELFRPKISPEETYDRYIDLLKQTDIRPLKMGYKNEWAYKGFIYGVQGHYSDDEIRLLILEDFDRGRKYFEKLKAKFDDASSTDDTFERPRIPESVRVEVWRRDGGKCARCGSRDRLEYDHIVPISKGGSNTARNIELLCENHNRSKSNNVV